MDEVEDAHMCLRCRATIVGLNNYVSHRRAGCAPAVAQKTKHRHPQQPDKGRESYEREDSGKTGGGGGGGQETVVQYSSASKTFQRDTKFASHEESQEALSHPEGNVDGAKYASSTSVQLGSCYVRQQQQQQQQQQAAVILPVSRAQVSPLHDSYTVMEEFTSALPQSHSESQISNGHSSLKRKHQESLPLGHTQTPSQAPFTSYSDPLLPHGQESANISLFRQFDTFNDHSKIQPEGESESHSEAITLFKVASTSYELESQNFESRYSEFYSLQPPPQETLLSAVPTLEQCKAKQAAQILMKIEENLENQNTKERELDTEKRSNQELGVSGAEFKEGNLKYSEPQLPSGNGHTAQENSELRQDDFLSSLELRSSVKAPTKRRHEGDEELDEDEDDDTRPPHHHTGGKWRPGSRPPPSVGGKWRPSTPKIDLDEEEDMEDDDAEEDDDSLIPPPPSHTKGKWLPGKKSPHERHTNSDLHLVGINKASGRNIIKTSKVITSSTISSRPVRSKKLEAQSFLKSTIAQMKSRKIVSSGEKNKIQTSKRTNMPKSTNEALVDKTLPCVKQEVKKEANVDEEEEVQKVSVVTPKLLCPICKLSFGEPYTALHIASLAHIHNELEYKQNTCDEIDDNFNQIILNNFSAILKTSPFMCSECKFYCNLQEDFFTHMKTHVAGPEDDEVKTLYVCSACTDEDEMQLSGVLRHLQTPHHLDNARDTVLQARQVILSSRTAVVCPLGDGAFRYRRQYRTHCRIHHKDSSFQASDQRSLRCPHCTFKALRERQIRAHIRETHENKNGKSTSYHCFVCGLAFSTHRQAELHRRSAEHRATLERQSGMSVVRTCSLCYEELEDLPALRRHMCQEHKKDSTPCHLCGVVPPLRSDLAQHQRFCSGVPQDLTGDHKCDLCNFKNDLLAHVLAHKTLTHGQRGPDTRYVCHICKTNLRLSSVKGHMLSHSNEWPYACHLCSRKFPQQLWLERHLTMVHTQSDGSRANHAPALCHTCGKTLLNRWHLHRHTQEAHTHAPPSPPSDKGSQADSEPKSCHRSCLRSRRGKRLPPPPSLLCDVCGVQCETCNKLKVHRQGHKQSAGDEYGCPHCNYTTARLPHLRRHLRLHTGSTPFSCPYCAYVCNNQENLRKHMLKTKRHPGRFMYECRLCDSSQDPEATYDKVPVSESNLESAQTLNLDSSPSQPLNLGVSTSQPLNLGVSTSLPLSLGVSISEPINIGASTSHTLTIGSTTSQSLNFGSPNSQSLNLASPITQALNLCPSTSQVLNLGSSPSHCFHSGTSSTQPLEPGNSKTLDFCVPKSMDIDESQSLCEGEPLCFSSKESSSLSSKNDRLLECDVFKSNYATEFQAHLLEKHRKVFETKDDVTSHIRSYYRPEDDTTVTNTPLPFVHKKRHSRRPVDPSVKSEDQEEEEEEEDPGSEDTVEGEEDVLSQTPPSGHQLEYVAQHGVPEDEHGQATEVVEEEVGAGSAGELPGRGGTTSGNFHLEAEVRDELGRQFPAGAANRGTRFYLRAPNRPYILRPNPSPGGGAPSTEDSDPAPA
ncbi:uncharacterized protein [Procambarus clarkii]|uniref:uncharacterized protein n=1 Tax=Procambarus clarkii TaxID=6728 RepID=UPI0037449CA3